MGSDIRVMSRGELLNRQALGKSLVATRDIEIDETISAEMVAAKSPGRGLSPLRLDHLIGTRANRRVNAGEMFTASDIDGRSAPTVCRFPTGWGLVVRPNDLDALLVHQPSLVEVHLSDRDLDAGVDWAKGRQFVQQLAVHAPEYCYDRLIDFCAGSAEVRAQSVARIQRTLDYAAELASHFAGPKGGPSVIVHLGGMSREPHSFDMVTAEARIIEGLATLKPRGVQMLVENLPPLAWYFGGQWFQHAMTDADHIRRVCDASGYGLCFDTSHAALYCNHAGLDLIEYARSLKPYIRHLHVADAAGTSGEGLQIREGQVDFDALLPLLLAPDVTVTLEIWQGHHDTGAGFATAMARLGEMAVVQQAY